MGEDRPAQQSICPTWAGYMPGYINPNSERAEQLNTQAAELFAEGTEAGEKAGKYVRLTVLFALVLFLIAAGQRFRQRPVRISANALAVCLLVYALVDLISCLGLENDMRRRVLWPRLP